ncbi:hypothetical protein Pmani_027072 [Petrolisthes manimaculis]|uniref:Uncharacterized protein n=1 Tax=Petrolisthes manimaculis TaxID=1843537 RepID=A0AAE1P4S1_9EUCA|nr:hypothetical protein Pmani_027072 [Petrolisthes manimaculis]
MVISNAFSTLRRSTPSVVECFRNAQLYRSEVREKPAELVVLFTWLGAKQKYAHKYAKCWTRRGHDVLHVTTSVRDLLFPRTGAEVTASRVVDYIDKRNDNTIVHGLSVGGYLTQRVMMAAQDSVVNITHQIFDSFTNCVGMEAGVQNAVAPRFRNIAIAGANLYVKYADLSSIYEARNFACSTPCVAPCMYMHSLADQVSLYPDMKCLIEAQEKVSPVITYLIPEQQKVQHVSIMKYLGEHNYSALMHNFIDSHRGQDCSPSARLEYLTVPNPSLEGVEVAQ